jgi:hypothetical protein
LLDTAFHHQPHAQAQQQHGKYHNNNKIFGLHMLQDNSSLDNCRYGMEQTWEKLLHCAPPEKPMCKTNCNSRSWQKLECLVGVVGVSGLLSQGVNSWARVHSRSAAPGRSWGMVGHMQGCKNVMTFLTPKCGIFNLPTAFEEEIHEFTVNSKLDMMPIP